MISKENENECENIEKVLYHKDNISISKTKEGEYHMQCQMENPRIYIKKIVDFELIKLIYDLNKDVYEKTDLIRVSETKANILFIMKNIFPDLGLPRRFCYIQVIKEEHREKIVFRGKILTDEKDCPIRPDSIPNHLQPFPLQQIETTVTFLSDHTIHISNKMKIISHKFSLMPWMEKTISKLIYKMFSRVKQFIENLAI